MIAMALLPVKPASFRLFASSFARGSLSPTSRSRYNRPVVSLDIRPVTSDELNSFPFLVSYAFSSDRSPEGRERMKHIEAIGQDYALYEDGEMVACLRLFPMRMFIHGASLPGQRRKGYVGRLLRHALGVMREEGQTLSSLWTPHASLYRRYGWMVASEAYFYRFNPKEITPGDAAPVPHIATKPPPPTARAAGGGGGGEPRGYVVYHSEREHRTDGPDVTKLVAEELIALDGDAYRGLVRYLLRHDPANPLVLWARSDEALPLAG